MLQLQGKYRRNILSKVFEKIMYPQLPKFLDYHKILVGNQIGFRQLHSSYVVLLLKMDQVTKVWLMEKKGILLDFSKAFDTINRAILLDEIQHYSVRDNASDWIRSSFSDRKQYVSYNGVSSSTTLITCVVPQGSLPGILLY